MSDEPSVTRFAQKFRLEAAAALVAILRDPDASPNARANAAEKIILHSDGRPGASKPITVTDLASMSDEERMQLLKALVGFYRPNAFTELVAEAVDAAIVVERERQAAAEARQTRQPPPMVTLRRTAPIRPPVVAPPVQEVLPPDLNNVVPLSPPNSNANTASPDIEYQARLRAFKASEPVSGSSYRGASGVLYHSESHNHADVELALLRARLGKDEV